MNRPKKIALISSRPQGANVQLSVDLKNSEIKLLSFPLTEIHPLNNYQIFDGVIENIKTYQHIIFIIYILKVFLKVLYDSRFINLSLIILSQ